MSGTPRKKTSVFDRLFHHDTASSATRKHESAARRSGANNTPSPTPSARKRAINVRRSKSKKRYGPDEPGKALTEEIEERTQAVQITPTPAPVPQAPDAARSTSSAPVVPETKPKPVPRNFGTPVKFLISSKYNPERGFSPLSISGLGLAREVQSYLDGEITSQSLAHSIISELFDRDFSPGKRWDVDPAWVTPIDVGGGEEGGAADHEEGEEAFKAEKEATWDWKDIYSVAASRATAIRFLSSRGEVRIENYSYYVAG